MCGLIKKAHEEKVSPTQVKGFLKQHLNKGEAKAVSDAFSGPDVINLPPGENRWRLSNAISLLARETENEHRSLELQQIAGKLVA